MVKSFITEQEGTRTKERKKEQIAASPTKSNLYSRTWETEPDSEDGNTDKKKINEQQGPEICETAAADFGETHRVEPFRPSEPVGQFFSAFISKFLSFDMFGRDRNAGLSERHRFELFRCEIG